MNNAAISHWGQVLVVDRLEPSDHGEMLIRSTYGWNEKSSGWDRVSERRLAITYPDAYMTTQQEADVTDFKIFGRG